MSKPKIVVFWGKPKGSVAECNPQPLNKIGPKKPVYDELLEELSRKAEVFISFGYENYTSPLVFGNCYKYMGRDNFVKTDERIRADAVLDRSAKMIFPGVTQLENLRVLNASTFKNFCNNKWALYQKFPEYCPKTRYAETFSKYNSILDTLDKNMSYVVKPYNGLKGRGIRVGKPETLRTYTAETPVVIQDFKETGGGIPGVTMGRHDLRVVVANGEIIWATIRQPQGGGFLANVAQGGSITEIKISKIPQSVLPIAEHLSRAFKKDYFDPFFSIDLGFEDGVPFIYEINDQIGFPLPKMENNTFVRSLADALIRRAGV